MKTKSFLSVLCLSFGSFLQTLNAQNQVNLIASKDNTLYESNNGGFSNGIGVYLFAGKTGHGETRRGLVAFNIANNIPAGSTIDSVKLTLFMSRSISDAQTIRLFRVLADWGEGTSNASVQEGAGASSTSGDATWIHRFFNTSLWARVGGDFATTVSASQAVGGQTVGDSSFYTWGSTPQMVADVQSWLDTPANNFGWLLLGNESASTTVKRFDTRENPASAKRPTLTVFYRLQTSVAEQQLQTPLQFHLAQNYPNPFSGEAKSRSAGNPGTTIRFYLPTASLATLQILDVSGRVIATLVEGKINAGEHTAQWYAENATAGIYFYRLQAGAGVQTKKLIVLR